MGVLDAGKGLHLFVDEVTDVGVAFDIEFYQQIVVPRGGVDLGGDLGLGERVGDGSAIGRNFVSPQRLAIGNSGSSKRFREVCHCLI